MRDSPIQFRPGPTLQEALARFARERGCPVSEAARSLLALAAVGLDVRYEPLVRQLADAWGGSCRAFVRACAHVGSALEGAECATGRRRDFDAARGPFVLNVVRLALAPHGLGVTGGPWFWERRDKGRPRKGTPCRPKSRSRSSTSRAPRSTATR